MGGIWDREAFIGPQGDTSYQFRLDLVFKISWVRSLNNEMAYQNTSKIISLFHGNMAHKYLSKN